MSDFREFNFCGIPGEPHKISIDLDEVGSYNECLPSDGFKYTRTNIHLKGQEKPCVVIDMEYNKFKKIMNTKII